MASRRLLLKLFLLSCALIAVPRAVQAQGVVRPHASTLWAAAAGRAAPNTMSVQSQQSRGAIIGGVLGAALGGLFGHAICRKFGSSSADRCLGDTMWWAVIGGGLGLLIGSSAGHEADQKSRESLTR